MIEVIDPNLSRVKAVGTDPGVTPATLLTHSEASLPLRHHRVLQLPLLDDRHIRLLAMDAHNNDVGIARLPVIGAHQGVPRIDELPPKLEEIGLRDNRRQRGRTFLRQTSPCHRSHTAPDLTRDVRLSLRLGEASQTQRRYHLLRYSSDLCPYINRLGVEKAEMDACRKGVPRLSAHRPPHIRTGHHPTITARHPGALIAS